MPVSAVMSSTSLSVALLLSSGQWAAPPTAAPTSSTDAASQDASLTGGPGPETKPSETKPSEPKPSETKPSETKPSSAEPTASSGPGGATKAGTPAAGGDPAPPPTTGGTDVNLGQPFGPPPKGFPVPEGAPHDRVGPPPGNQPRSGASGVGAVTPLPPPPPSVDPRRILTKPWRGDGFLTMKLTTVGSLAGAGDLRGNLTSVGGAVEGGWRANNYVAVGAGLTRNLHVRTRRIFYDSFDGAGFVYADTAGLTHFDFAFVRGYAPVKGRAQPWLDVGGGLAVRDAVDVKDARVAGSMRATLGFDGWVSRNTSIQLGLQYRLIAAPGSIAHTLGGSIGLGFHW